MNDEIKEVLDRIETASEIFDCLLKPEECTKLLDYITKLQEDIRTGQEINSELKQENEKLKAQVTLLEDNRLFLNKKIGQAIKSLKQECMFLEE